MTNALMASLQPELNANFPDIAPGDTVRVHQRIVEGRNERIQTFQGVIIAMRGGKSAGATYTARRTGAHGRHGSRRRGARRHWGEGRSAAQGTRPSRPAVLSARPTGKIGQTARKAFSQGVAQSGFSRASAESVREVGPDPIPSQRSSNGLQTSRPNTPKKHRNKYVVCPPSTLLQGTDRAAQTTCFSCAGQTDRRPLQPRLLLLFFPLQRNALSGESFPDGG